MGTGPVWGGICEMDIVMDIEISYVSNMTLQTLWPEGKGEGFVSSLASAVMVYRISENMIGTDKDHTEIDSRLLVSFCCENSVVLYLHPVNYGKWWQRASSFG
jgi:hypothetical protein